ncbi:POTRA domain-containing protein [Leptotrichia sp. HSP-536]|uniref:POTRA domain-containing protein n=1 Tax=Leptotrichia alba TaxID=3239304 RepID=A0AB39V6V1_9FUSO
MLKHKIFSFIIAATLITSINNLTWADNEQHIAETDDEVLVKEKEEEREDEDSENLFYISNVDIEGMKTFDKKYFLENLPIKAGDNASSKKIIEGAKKYLKRDFASVNLAQTYSYNSISVLYKVKENPIVRSINLKGNTLYITEELIKASGIKIGEILNGNLLYPYDNGIINLYVKDGYLGARIESINVSDEGDINIELTEGVVDSVEFTNMKYRNNDKIPSSLKTKPYIFERSQAIKPGQIFQKENIEATIKSLYRTGIFDRVEPFIEDKEDDPNARIVKFHVEERQTVSQKIDIGYVAELGIHKSFRLSDSNFLGKGQNASIEYFDTTKGNKNFTINWYEPWLRGTDHVGLFGSVYWEQSVDIAAKSDEVKKAKTIGTFWTISKSLDKLDKDIDISLSTSFRNIKELFANKKVNDKYKLFQINPRLIYDKRNDKINPTKGIYAEISYKKGKLVNDPRKFDNFEIDLKAYHPTFLEIKI